MRLKSSHITSASTSASASSSKQLHKVRAPTPYKIKVSTNSRFANDTAKYLSRQPQSLGLHPGFKLVNENENNILTSTQKETENIPCKEQDEAFKHLSTEIKRIPIQLNESHNSFLPRGHTSQKISFTVKELYNIMEGEGFKIPLNRKQYLTTQLKTILECNTDDMSQFEISGEYTCESNLQDFH